MVRFEAIFQSKNQSYLQTDTERHIRCYRWYIYHEIQEPFSIEQIDHAMDEQWRQIIDQSLQGIRPDEEVKLKIDTHNEKDSDPFYMNYTKSKDVDYQHFTKELSKMSQSNLKFFLSGIITVHITVTNRLSFGFNSIYLQPIKDYYDKNSKNSYFCINLIKGIPDENVSGWFAIALGLAYYKFKESKDATWRREWKSIKANRKGKLAILAKELCQDFGFDYDNNICNISHLEKIQEKIGKDGFNIILVKRPYNFKQPPEKPLYIGGQSKKIIGLDLVFSNNSTHFNLFVSLPVFFNCKKFCIKCWRKLNVKITQHHICKDQVM